MIKLLRQELADSIAQIDAGNTNLTNDQMINLIEYLAFINKGVKRISKAYACEHILHINTNKFNYLMSKGIIPKGRHELGFKEESWRIADFDNALKYISEHKKSL